MNSTERRIEPVTYDLPSRFDDRLWPVHLALWVLAAFLSGAATSAGSFRDPLPWRNPLFWITIICAATVAAMWCVHKIPTRYVQRGIWLSGVLSLILHLGFLWLLTHVFLHSHSQPSPPLHSPPRPQSDAVVVPEYAFAEVDAEPQRHAFDHPIEAQMNDESLPTETDVSQDAVAFSLPTPQELPPLPQSHPSLSPVRRQQPTEPDLPARMSPSPLRRHLAEHRPKASRIPRRSVRSAQEEPSASEQAQSVSVAAGATLPRQRSHSQTARDAEMGSSGEPIVRVDDIAPALVRRRTPHDSQPESASADVVLPRRVRTEKAFVANKTVEVDVEELAAAATPREPASAEIQEISRSFIAASPIVMEMDSRPTDVTDESTRSAHERPTHRRQENAWDVLPPATIERRQLTGTPALTTTVDTMLEVPRGSATNSVASFALREQITGEPTKVNTADMLEKADVSAAPSPLDVHRVRRVESSTAETATIDPDLRLEERPRRAIRVADKPVASPAPVVPNRLAPTPVREPATAEPAAISLAKSEDGTAGMGRDSGFAEQERGGAAASVASNSMMRRRSTQSMEPGRELSPSVQVIVPRRVAHSTRPTDSSMASVSPMATISGSTQAEDAEQPAAATVEYSSANADVAELTADVGSANFDTGPSRTASTTAMKRNAGGGQQEVNFSPSSVQRSMRAQGSPPTSSLVSRSTQDNPAAPLARGAGSPAHREIEASAIALARQAAASTDGELGSTMQLNDDAPGAVSLAPREAAPRRAPASADSLHEAQFAADARAIPRRSRHSRPFVATRPAITIQWAGGERSSGPEGLLASSAPTERELGDRATNPGSESALSGPSLRLTKASGSRLHRDELVQSAGGVASSMEEQAAATDLSPTPSALPRRDAGAAPRAVIDGEVASISSGAPSEVDPRDVAAGLAPSPGESGESSRSVRIDGFLRMEDRPEASGLLEMTARRRSASSRIRPVTSSGVVLATDAYSMRRTRRNENRGLSGPAALPKTEIAVERGLQFLARVQGTDGRWSLHRFGDGLEGFENEIPSMRSDTAATGLALLAFLGAGYQHRDDIYQTPIQSGLNFLLRNQQEDGNLFVPEDKASSQSVALYSHGIAALALSEAYGMTQDPDLRDASQRAIDYILQSQHPRWGGWRYSPGISSDTSVSGWMIMALKSGEMANLRVSSQVYAGVDRWLDAAQASDEQPHLFRYNPYAPRTATQRHGRTPTPTITSVGLLMRLYRGMLPIQPTLVQGAEYLLKHRPALGTRTNPQRDTYYWYYATQFMFHMGGDYWETWNKSLHPLLVDHQVVDGEYAGSWRPFHPVPDRWSPHAGRLYLTTMNLLSLEVYYRHLPLYHAIQE